MSGPKSNKPNADSMQDEPREFVHDARARFAPADNLYDAIRADIAHLGEFEFRPLGRQGAMRIPFFDPDADGE
jgi:hypothetical protein